MFSQVVTFQLNQLKDVQPTAQLLRSMAGTIESLRAIEVNVSDSAVMELVTVFDDEAGYTAYVTHPKHQSILEELGRVVSRKEVVDRPHMDVLSVRKARTDAREFLQQFVDARPEDRERLIGLIKPHDEDWARVFLPEYAELAREAYAEIWEEDAEVPNPGMYETEVMVDGAAPPAALRPPSPHLFNYPRRFKETVEALQPEPIWVCWKFVARGTEAGTSYEGLVRVTEERWAWFPRLWRCLRIRR